MIRPRPATAVCACLVFLACRSTATPAGPEPADRALAAELLQMSLADQDARAAWLALPRDASGRTGPDGEAAAELVQRLDREHTQRMKQIVAEHGWPTRSLVGVEGSHAAWLLVQHADRDPEFQAKCLELMRAAVAAGEADASELAYLEDRVRVAQGRLQLYGTQLESDGTGGWRAKPVEDPGGLDARRAKLGLPPMADYLEMVRQMQGR